jgi:phage recombination protein Bet
MQTIMSKKENTGLVERNASGAPIMAISKEQIDVLAGAGIIPPGTPAAQVQVFAEVASRHNLDPFTKQVHLVKYRKKDGERYVDAYAVIIGIDGYRARATSSGRHAGTEDAKFNITSDGKHVTAAELIAKNGKLLTATVTVHKIVSGMKVPFTHTCVLSEFSSGKQKWHPQYGMQYQMLAKCAEAFALRKAFPNETAGLAVEEELAAYEDAQEFNHDAVVTPDGYREGASSDAVDVPEAFAEDAEIVEEDALYLQQWTQAIDAVVKGKGSKQEKLDELLTLYRNNIAAVGTSGKVFDMFSEAKATIKKTK